MNTEVSQALKGWSEIRDVHGYYYNVAVNYFNCITTAGMKQLAIAMYGPAWAGITL